MRQRFGECAERLTSGDLSSLRDLGRLVGATAAAANAEDVAWLRLGLSQLMGYDLDDDVRGEIGSLDVVLEGSQLHLDASRSEAMREDHRRTVKERLVEALRSGVAMRPRELVDACEADAYQVSRALRDLRAGGLVDTAPPPQGAEVQDGRGVWYQLGTAAIARGLTSPPPLNFRVLVTGSYAHGAYVRSLVHDVDVWPAASPGVPVEAEPALRRLTDAWLALLLEEGLPGGTAPGNLDAIADRFVDADSFAATHDLARVLGASSQGPVWLTREGRRCWILTRSSVADALLDDVMAQLAGVGDSLLELIGREGPSHAKQLATAWARRAERPAVGQIATATQLTPEILAKFSDDASAADFWEYADAVASSELVAAARMASSMGADVVRSLVETVRQVGRTETDELDALSSEAEALVMRSSQLRPYEQGYALAAWLRTALGLTDPGERVDPDVVLDAWKVRIVVTTSVPEIDGFACWGPRHGPMVAVNKNGRHSEFEAGRRATLAHEIAHLLVDRRGALPLAEVLGGQTAPISEARAGAFAAELLLPRAAAGRTMSATGDAEKDVTDLAEHYGVSREVIAWQARNSGAELSSSVREYLRHLVSAGRMF